MTTLPVELLGGIRELAAVPLPSDTPHPGGLPLRRYAVELHVPDERHQELEAEPRRQPRPTARTCAGARDDGASWTAGARSRRAVATRSASTGWRSREVGLADQPILARTAERVMANSRALADLLAELHARGVLDARSACEPSRRPPHRAPDARGSTRPVPNRLTCLLAARYSRKDAPCPKGSRNPCP